MAIVARPLRGAQHRTARQLQAEEPIPSDRLPRPGGSWTTPRRPLAASPALFCADSCGFVLVFALSDLTRSWRVHQTMSASSPCTCGAASPSERGRGGTGHLGPPGLVGQIRGSAGRRDTAQDDIPLWGRSHAHRGVHMARGLVCSTPGYLSAAATRTLQSFPCRVTVATRRDWHGHRDKQGPGDPAQSRA